MRPTLESVVSHRRQSEWGWRAAKWPFQRAAQKGRDSLPGWIWGQELRIASRAPVWAFHRGGKAAASISNTIGEAGAAVSDTIAATRLRLNRLVGGALGGAQVQAVLGHSLQAGGRFAYPGQTAPHKPIAGHSAARPYIYDARCLPCHQTPLAMVTSCHRSGGAATQSALGHSALPAPGRFDEPADPRATPCPWAVRPATPWPRPRSSRRGCCRAPPCPRGCCRLADRPPGACRCAAPMAATAGR
jgi:hypothetical protein